MRLTLALTGVLMLGAVAGVHAQAPSAAPPPPSQGTVSREEYDKLKREQDQMRQEMEELKRELRARPAPVAPAPAPAVTPTPAPTETPAAKAAPTAEAPTAEDFDDLQKEVKGLKDQLGRAAPGTSSLFISGDMDVSFTNKKGEKSTFETGFAPLILFQPTDRILIEAAADIGIGTDSDNNSSTSFDLTIANISYLVNDNVAVGAGLFVVPFGVYHNHFDPPWINKFADDPLPFGDGGIAPSSQVGVFARGAYAIRSQKIVYDVYVTNGPNVFTNSDAAGSLNFADYTDLNDNKAVGGRIGWLPVPNLEMGYSIQAADASPSGFDQNVDAVLQAVDINHRVDSKKLGGILDMRAEWMISNVSDATYDANGSQGFGPTRFGNYRQGGYAQLCYRPTHSDNPILQKTEFVSRYDWLIQPLNAPGGDHEKRFTLGVDYWITPAVVVKAAYEFDNKELGENQNAFLVQVGVGF